MVILSRRKFLGLSVAVTGGALTALVAAQNGRDWLLAPLRALYGQLLSPVLEDAPTGPLSTRALDALLAATKAIAGVPVQISHYEEFFRWRAENLPGYKVLYEQFAVALDRRVRRSAGCDFIACSGKIQQSLLDGVPQLHNAATKWDKLRILVLERDWLLFERYILRDILLLFSKTDAWAVLGYEDRPGTPRGLDRYTQAPRNA